MIRLWRLVFGDMRRLRSACVGVLLAPMCLIAQSAADSIAVDILSAHFGTRAAAVSRALTDYQTFPAQVRDAIVILVKREAAGNASLPRSEEYGEFLIDLAVATVRTGDTSTRRALISLGGHGVSGGVAAFVASGGAAMIAVLDSAAIAEPDDAESVLLTFALMYSRYGERLSAADSSAVLGRILAAASSADPVLRQQFALLAVQLPLPDAVPLLQALAAEDTARLMPEGVHFVRNAAADAATALQSAYAALTPSGLSALLLRERAGACDGVTGSLRGHCESMRAHLETLHRHIAAGAVTPARQAVDSFLKSIGKAAGAGLAAPLVTLMAGNARRISVLIR